MKRIQEFWYMEVPSCTEWKINNALEPGTVVPIHRHTRTTETVVMLRGRGIQYIYNDAGEVIDRKHSVNHVFPV